MTRTAISAIATSWLAAAPAAGQCTGRLFFDLAGNGGVENAPHPGSLAMENPQLPPGGGRLYIYWEFGQTPPSPQHWLAVNHDVTIDGGLIEEAFNYQPIIPVFNQPRWQPVPGNPAPNPAIDPGGNTSRFTAVNINAFGLKNDAAAVHLDQGYDADSNTTILGYVDVIGDAGAAVWITVDELGVSIQGGCPDVAIYLGFGDGPVRRSEFRSEMPEATIIPEPATAVILAVAALGLHPRSRRTRTVG